MKNSKKIILVLVFSLLFSACSKKQDDNNKANKVEETKKETPKETIKETTKETIKESKEEIDMNLVNEWFDNLVNFPHGTTGSSLRAVKLLNESLNLNDYSDKVINHVLNLYNKIENKKSIDMTISLLSNNIEEFKNNPTEYKQQHEDAGVKFENENNINKLENLVNKLKESSQISTNDEPSDLSENEKESLERFVDELKNIPNGTAGSGLKIIGVFYESLNYATVFEIKPDLSIDYINSLVKNLDKKKNFIMSLNSLKYQIKEYKKDNEEYINSNKSSGYEWDPSISIESYENVINKIVTE